MKMSQYKALVAQQHALEIKYSKMNRTTVMEFILSPIKQAIVDAAEELKADAQAELDKNEFSYVTKDGEEKVREDLIEVYTTLTKIDVYAAFMDVYAAIVDKKPQTIQSVAGRLMAYTGDIEMVSRKLQVIEMLLVYCPHCHVDVEKGAEYAYVWSDIELDKEEQERLKYQTVTLPSVAPLRKVTSNSDIGYRTFKKSVLMGGKHHNFKVNLNHINLRNRVGFAIEPRVFERHEPVFNEEFKITKKGTVETEQEREDRRASWLQLHKDMPKYLKLLLNKKLHFAHRKDNRYRTYSEQYIVNYQGNDTQKAIVELHKKEVISGDW